MLELKSLFYNFQFYAPKGSLYFCLYCNFDLLFAEKHVVGKVPDKADFLSALTGGKGIESLTQKQSTAAPGLPGSFGGSSKRIQTIDLTKSSEVERKQQEEKISYAPKHPPYHAVSQAASSMQKDFTTHKFDPKTMQGMSIVF